MLQTTDQKDNDEILFSVGMIADIQYADADDGFNYTKTRQRRFRNALKILKNAIKIWNNNDDNTVNTPSFIVSIGDVIDIVNSKTTPKQSISAMQAVLKEFNLFKPSLSNKQKLLKNIATGSHIYNDDNGINNNTFNDDNDDQKSNDNNQLSISTYPIFHNLVGNHELYNFNRKQLSKYMYHKINVNNDDINFYYSFTPHPGYLFIMLDSYEISILGYKYCNNNNQKYIEAETLLNKYNPNSDKHVPVPTFGFNRRFRAFNGAFGCEQLLWLETKLKIAEERKDNVMLFSHVPIYTNKNKDYDILQWDYKKLIKLINQYKCVKMYFAGHDHIGDFYKDNNGVYYLTFEGVIESMEFDNKPMDCFATADFYKDKLILKGYGMVADGTYPFRSF